MHCTRNVTEDLIWVGAEDRRLRSFEGQYDVPDGISYNSYVLTDEKTVLFDTVDKAVSRLFFENAQHALAGRQLDYIVVHHVEPDHTETLAEAAARWPSARIVCSAAAKKMLENFFRGALTGRFMTVSEGDTLKTGRHELTFITAPMVHWPEVMVSYDKTDKILFSADAFGAFGAAGGRIFADEVDFFGEKLCEARRYYANIVGKYGAQVQALLKKVGELEINIVCPLHGFILRERFGDFLEKYCRWSSYAPEKQGVVIAYASVYGNTANAANILACRLAEHGVQTRVYDTSVTAASYILADAFQYSHLVFASPTYNAGIFTPMESLLRDIAGHNLQNRRVALIENGSWAPVSACLMQGILEKLPGTEFIQKPVTIRSSPCIDDVDELEALAVAIADEICPAPCRFPGQPQLELPTAAVDAKALRKFVYGVQVLTTRAGGEDFGCIINSAAQAGSGEPKTLTVACIKENHTCGKIAQSGEFNLSVLTKAAPFSIFELFGLKSGRDVDKFALYEGEARTENGLRYIAEFTNAVFSCRVIEAVDVGTHMLFIGEVTQAEVLSDEDSCTYDYYHAHIKPKKAPVREQKEGYICKICGYFHEGAELPEDFICPLCRHGAADFEYVPPSPAPKRHGYVCRICGRFEPSEGKLPADYACPLCHHGPEDFEPAVQ